MEIQKIIKLFLFNFLFIAFNSNAQWITIENCHPETYTYSVHVGYTGPNNNTPVYEVRHMNYTVCNPTAVWAGPGSPDTPPPPPSTGSGNNGGGSSGGGTGGSQSEEDRRRICNQNADVLYATCASNFMNTYSTTMTNDCSILGPISPLFSNCQAVAQARRDAGIANCQVTKATYIAQVCQ